MSQYPPQEYSFLGLTNYGEPLNLVTSLGYVIGLVDTTQNPIVDTTKANFVLTYLYDEEEQTGSPADLLDMQRRTFPRGYHPQTPVMLTKGWSPMAAMLEKNIYPHVLHRSPSYRAVATGIWEPISVPIVVSVDKCEDQENLFWAVLDQASHRARARKLLISVIAKPGWFYEEPGVLPNWTEKQITEADRILWRRTPEG
jgi:hypothetical protein